MMNPDFQEAHNLILKSRKILILSHVSPDPDTIGCALALRLALKQFIGKERVFIGCQDRVPEICKFLPSSQDITTGNDLDSFLKVAPSPDLVITVDVANTIQIGEAYNNHLSFFKKVKIINIDHHYLSNTNYGSLNIVLQYSSNAEVVYEFLAGNGYDITIDIATCLMAGIITDTGRFSTPLVNAHTFETAANLIDKGISLPEITTNLVEMETLERAKLWGEILANIMSDITGQIVWVAVPYEKIKDSSHGSKLTSNIATYLRSLDGAKIGIAFLQQGDNTIKVSMRARQLDVRTVATKFGGGGHLEAAGCLLDAMPLENAIKMILSEIEKIELL